MLGGDVDVRVGLTLPLGGLPLIQHRDVLRELVSRGYTAAWAGEANGLDAVVPLAAAAAWEPTLHVGTGVLPAATRGPGLLAMTAAGLSELAPGRVSFGIGASSPVVVQHWNAADHTHPYARTRDVLRFVQAALGGERVDQEYETFTIRGFRLERPPEQRPPLLLAALRPRMLRLAGAEADGAVITWVGAHQVPRLAAELRAGAPDGARRRLVAWVTVCPDDAATAVRDRARPVIAAYLNVPSYAQLHRWLDNDRLLQPVWRAWAAGDRRGAVAAVSDELVDELVVHGPAEACRERLLAYAEAGVTELALAVQPGVPDPLAALRALAPS